MLFSFLPSILHFSCIWYLFICPSTSRTMPGCTFWNILLLRTPNYWNILLTDILTCWTRLSDHPVLSGHGFLGHIIIWARCYRTHLLGTYSTTVSESRRTWTTPFDREMLNFIKVGSRPNQGRLSSPWLSHGTACSGTGAFKVHLHEP